MNLHWYDKLINNYIKLLHFFWICYLERFQFSDLFSLMWHHDFIFILDWREDRFIGLEVFYQILKHFSVCLKKKKKKTNIKSWNSLVIFQEESQWRVNWREVSSNKIDFDLTDDGVLNVTNYNKKIYNIMIGFKAQWNTILMSLI